jgi:hypothetical protein
MADRLTTDNDGNGTIHEGVTCPIHAKMNAVRDLPAGHSVYTRGL